MVGNPEDKSSRIEAQITSMSQFNFPKTDNFFLLIILIERQSMSMLVKRFKFT